MSWRLGEEGFPCPAGCCRGHCQITLICSLKPAGASPASHRFPILRHHFGGPHPAQSLNLRQHLAVTPAVPVTKPVPSGYLRLDATGRVPAGTTSAVLLPARSGCLLRSARVQAAGGNQRSWLEKIWAKAREKKKYPGTWQDPTQVSMRNPTWPSLARACAGALPGLSRGQRRCQCPPNFRQSPSQAWSRGHSSGCSTSPFSHRYRCRRFPDTRGADCLLLLL